MPGIIESFVVSIGLGTDKIRQEQAEVIASVKRTGEEARRAGEIAERSAQRVGDTITRVGREIVALFGAFIGLRALKDFTTEITQANSALGRMATNLEVTPQALAAWGAGAERLGGKASDTVATFERIGKALYELRTNGKPMAQEFYRLQAETGKNIDTNHGLTAYLRDTAAALKALSQIDPSKAHFFAQSISIDDGTYQLMIKYGAGIDAYVADVSKAISPTAEAINNAQKLLESYKTFEQTVAAFIDRTLSRLTPMLTQGLEKLTDWIDINKDAFSEKILRGVSDFVDWLSDIYPYSLSEGFRAFAAEVSEVVSGLNSLISGLNSLIEKVGIFFGYQSEEEKQGVKDRGLQPYVNPDAVHGEGEPVLDPSVMNDNLNPGIDPQTTNSIEADGRPVSKANPMPVAIAGKGDGASGGFWSTLLGGIRRAARDAAGTTLPVAHSTGNDGTGSGVIASGSFKATAKHGWYTPERQAYIYKYLREKIGASDAGAKGLLSRFMMVESTSRGPASRNSIGAWGIAQWLGSRKRGIDGNSNLDDQLDHIAMELNGPEALAGKLLRNARTIEEGAQAATAYERAENYNARTRWDDHTSKTLGAMRAMQGLSESLGVLTGAFGAATVAAAIPDTAQHGRDASADVGEVNIHTDNDPARIAAEISGAIRMRWENAFPSKMAGVAH